MLVTRKVIDVIASDFAIFFHGELKLLTGTLICLFVVLWLK